MDEVSDVVAAGEAFTGASDQHRIDFWIAIGLFQRLGQMAVHGMASVMASLSGTRSEDFTVASEFVRHSSGLSTQPRGRNTSASS